MSIITAVRTAREDADRYDHRNDTRIGEALDRIDAAVTDLADVLRIVTPDGQTLNAVGDARVGILRLTVNELRAKIRAGEAWSPVDEPDVEKPTLAERYAYTTVQIMDMRSASFRRGWDAGYAAAGGDDVIEVNG